MGSIKYIIILFLFSILFYTNCDTYFTDVESNSGLKSTCKINVPDNLRKPQTIDQVVTLIGALPKPLEVYCFVEALKPPLKIYAVNNFESAQPSAGQDSPRIFILSDNLILSVVPAGPGRNFLEMAQKVSTTSSIKGEIEFPILAGISAEEPYSHILDGPTRTACVFCHGNEKPYPSITTGPAFESGILVPDFNKRVRQSYLKYQTSNCEPILDDYRCKMLNAVFEFGQAQDGIWPWPN